jgi:hypothetical protein
MTATIWRACPSCGSASSSPMTRVASVSTARGLASRPPTAPANAPAPASTTAADSSAPAARTSAASAPAPSGPAPTSAIDTERNGSVSLREAVVEDRCQASTSGIPA